MLQNHTLNSVDMLSCRLRDAGVALQALPGTPLAVLTNESNCPTQSGGMPFDFAPAQILTTVTSATLNPDVTESAHTIAMADIIQVTSETVKLNLITARNVVSPIINSVHDAVQRALHDADTTAGIALSVQPDGYAAIWDSPVLLSMVDAHNEASLEAVPMPQYYPPRTAEELRQLLGTGAGRFDADVKEWTDIVGDDFLAAVYRDVFLDGGSSDSAVVLTLNRVMMTDFRNRNRSVAILLMARGLKDNIPYLDLLVAQAANNKQLIVEYPMRGQEGNVANAANAVIYVNADIYSQWLNDGGSVEILFGAYITDMERGYQQLIDSKAILVDAWTRRVALIRSAAQSNRFGIMRQTLMSQIAAEINNLADDQVVGQQRGPYYELLAKEVDAVILIDMDNLYQTCRRVVCAVMFPHTNAKLVLDSIDAVMAANPELSIREAALVAVIDILVGWVRKQIDMQRIG